MQRFLIAFHITTVTVESKLIMSTSNNQVSFPKMHVSLYVSNLNETVKFYTSFFNQEPSKVKEGYAKYELDSPALIISFVENAEKVKSNFGHLGIQVASDQILKEKLDLVKSHKLSFREEMGTSCCYALQDKFWVQDPDQIQWEVYYFHEDVEFNDPHYTIGNAEAIAMELNETKSKAKKKMFLSDLQNSSCAPGSGCC